MSSIETIEPIDGMVKSIIEHAGELNEEELVDLIHTSALAASLSRTDKGRVRQSSVLVSFITMAASALGADAANKIMDVANDTAATVLDVLVKHQSERCKECPDHGMCKDEEFDEPPPTVH